MPLCLDMSITQDVPFTFTCDPDRAHIKRSHGPRFIFIATIFISRATKSTAQQLTRFKSSTEVSSTQSQCSREACSSTPLALLPCAPLPSQPNPAALWPRPSLTALCTQHAHFAALRMRRNLFLRSREDTSELTRVPTTVLRSHSRKAQSLSKSPSKAVVHFVSVPYLLKSNNRHN